MKIFCSGIGGIGLSAYASHMHARGHDVSGSDRSESELTKKLSAAGIRVSYTQDGSALSGDTDLLIYSEAIPTDAPERSKARKLNILQKSYFEALGELTRGTKLIAVCGTHGKSSTTAMLAKVCIDNGFDPSVVVGTKMFELDGANWRKGESNLWIVEACEYRKSFLHLSPDTILMTNVDGDHFDAFESVDAYTDAFIEFLHRMPEAGTLILHGKDGASAAVAKSAGRAFLDADEMPFVSLATPGKHMQQNAQLVLAVAERLGIDHKAVIESIKTYRGSWRRMEEKGSTAKNVSIIDDYGHHPVEIRATLQAIKEKYVGRRLVCVFQPHTHDRTLTLWDEFTSAFSDASVVVIADVYDARPDTERDSVDMQKFVKDIETHSQTKVHAGHTLEETLSLLKKLLQPNDLLLIMGAGNIGTLADPKLY